LRHSVYTALCCKCDAR